MNAPTKAWSEKPAPPPIDEWFKYHSPSKDQLARMDLIRDAAKVLAQSIVQSGPPSADQTAALRLLREAVWTANAAVCLGPPEYEAP